MIYTHSHADHFGGVLGVLPDGAGDVPILAPEGFMEHAVSENVYAGTAMNRRANYMYGMLLPRSPLGQVSTGLGIATAEGTIGLIPPTVDITHTGQEETVDGVRIEFQITPGTEAPSEMNFLFPDHRALCMAENATHNLHNVLTLRGALVRDTRIWAHYLDEAIELFGDRLRRRVRVPPLADVGHARTSSGSCPSSGTCTPTSTTRPCGCSTRGSPASRSPRRSSSRPRSTPRGTCAATTARSATT